MIYSSLLFIYGFFPAALLLYSVTPRLHREKTMLVLSIIFCCSFGLFTAGILTLSILLNYVAGRITERFSSGAAGKAVLCLIILADIAVMFLFRADDLPGKTGELFLSIAYPLGISFFTLSAVGYQLDVFRGRCSAEHDIIRFSLYLIMFPKLIMGPLVSYGNYLRISGRRNFSIGSIGGGLAVFVRGLVKKLIGADLLYMLYSAVRSTDTGELSALSAWLGAAAYLLCVYFELSGFSDMGTGLGRCFGYSFPAAFRHPVLSSRITKFLSRWHMQVLHWFRRYILEEIFPYTPHRWLKALVTAAVCGMAGFLYTFTPNGMVCGLIIGAAAAAEQLPAVRRLPRASGAAYTFIIILFSGVILSGDTITGSLSYMLAMLGSNHSLADSLSLYLLGSYVLILIIGFFVSSELMRRSLQRVRRSRLYYIALAAEPVITLAFLALCTAMMSYSGSSAMLMFKL
ncbi:MAG: hypothetical protein IJ874_03585 [Ruminococcus sp.]|nr:hypothetical protein [Ruminococcus sp.]